MATVLFMGVGPQDPNNVLPPDVSAQALGTAIDQAAEDLKNAGYTVKLFLPPIMGGIDALEKELQTNHYDLVLVGLGVRGVPKHTPYFEGIINTVIKYNPGQRFAFNASLGSTLEAAQRALPV